MSTAEAIDFEETVSRSDIAGILNNRFRIDLSAPLNFLDKGANKAFTASDVRDPSAKCYAVISNPYVPYRPELAHALKTTHVPGILDLLDYGAVKFDEADIRQIFIFSMPDGGMAINAQEGPMPERQILDVLVPHVMNVFRDLERIGFTHRAIRVDNLFFADEDRTEFVLGEAVTTPPGSDQPTVYEPLESANANIYGRGNGTLLFDTYALGVMILHLLTGQLPRQDLSADALFTAKLEHGSFTALTEDITLSSRVHLLLTGLLHDDPKRRWNLETLERWREIMHDRPQPGRGERRGLSAIAFLGKDYNSPRLLAQALTWDPKAAVKLLENDKLANWARNSLKDTEIADMISEVKPSSIGTSKGHKRDEMTATTQLISLLDTEGSLWFKGIAFAWGGLGPVLAYAFMKDPDGMKATLAELLGNGVLLTVATNDDDWSVLKRRGWLSMSKASDCFEFMKNQQQLGFGLERCLYELNPTIACLSPNLVGSDIKTLSQFIEIAEKNLLKSGGNFNPFDRHCAAFIAAKSSGLRKYFSRLGISKQGDAAHTVALLKMAGHLQKVHHPAPLPGFCNWMETLITPLVGNIQSELRRELVRKKFESVRSCGNIDAILSALDIERQVKLDDQEYIRAIDEYVGAERLVAQLQNGSGARKLAAAKYGHWIASVISISALATSMALSSLYFLG